MTISKTLFYILFGILVLSFLLGLNASLRINKIEIPKIITFTETDIRKLADEETIKIINEIVKQQQAEQTKK